MIGAWREGEREERLCGGEGEGEWKGEGKREKDRDWERISILSSCVVSERHH